MSDWFTEQLLFDGLVRGLVFGLLAMAIVLVYRSTKVINFAVGNMGLIGAGLLVLTNSVYGVPFWISMAIAVVMGTAFGAVIELVVIRRLFRAPRVIVLVATIGVAQLALAILGAYPESDTAAGPFPQAIGSTWSVSGVQIRGSQLLVLIVAPAVALALSLFLNRTITGQAVTAAAGGPDLARLSGISPKLLSTLVWAIAGLVATVSLVLIGSLEGTSGSLAALGPATFMRTLAAAVIARLTSFRVALLAGVLIGVAESVVRFNFLNSPGLVDALLLGIVLVAVAAQYRGRSVEETQPFSFIPKVAVMPERLRSIFWVRNLDRMVLLTLLAVAVVLPQFVTQPSQHILYATIAAFAVCALSLTVLTGWAGQLSLGQMAFAGIGALTATAFVRGQEIHWVIGGVRLLPFQLVSMPFVVSIVLGALVAGLLSAAIGIGALRVRGLLLAASTFALAIAAQQWIYRLDVLSAGNVGSVPFPRGDLLGIDLDDQRTYYYFVLGALTLVFAVVSRVRRSGVGRVTLAVRDNADSAASYTVSPTIAKLRAFALAGFIAGLGGGLLAGASELFSLNNPHFQVDYSLALVAMVVIGGMGSPAGAVIGAVWVVGLPAIFPDTDIVPLLSSSLGLLILLLYFPGGFVNVAYRARTGLYRWLEARLPPTEKVAAAPPATIGGTDRGADLPDTVLRTVGITVAFRGIVANDRINIEVRNGEIVGLIGTNGAGKSTLMSAIGGYVPARGSIELLGDDVSHSSAAQRARRGLGRTFQAASLFPELTIRETVQVALEARGRSGLLETALWSPRSGRLERSKRAQAAEIIDFLGLGRYADRQIADLSTGTRRIVELAGLLALDARVLCLDEPTAGVAQREAEAMAPLLVEIRRQLDASMLVIEHDMPFIMSMSDRVYCLEVGRVIAEGEPADVRSDPLVIASYLGTDQRTIDRSGARRPPEPSSDQPNVPTT